MHYCPAHPFLTGTVLQAVCCSREGAVPAKEFFCLSYRLSAHFLCPIAYRLFAGERTMGVIRTIETSATSSTFPGVPSRTVGYYGPRAPRLTRPLGPAEPGREPCDSGVASGSAAAADSPGPGTYRRWSARTSADA